MEVIEWFRRLFWRLRPVKRIRIDSLEECKRLCKILDDEVERKIKRDVAVSTVIDEKTRLSLKVMVAESVVSFQAHCLQDDLQKAQELFPRIEDALRKAARKLGLHQETYMVILRQPTHSDKAHFHEINRRWSRLAVLPDPIDQEAASAAIKKFYAVLKLPVPDPILFFTHEDFDQQLAAAQKREPSHVLEERSMSGFMPAHFDGDDISKVPLKHLPFLMRLNSLGAGDPPELASSNSGPSRDIRELHHIVRELLQLEDHFSQTIGGRESFIDLLVKDFADEIGKKLPRVLDKKLAALKEVVKVTGSVVCLGDWAIVIGRPVEAHYDEQERLHKEDGPALVMTGGRSFYHWHGVLVPKELVLSPQSLTAEVIRKEKNTETRQVMMDRMGAERFMRELDGKEMHRDKTGILWRVELTPEIRISSILKRPEHKKLLPTHMKEEEIKELFLQLQEDEWRDIIREGEIWQAVEVVNSSAEPDGTFKTYFLSVPPTIATAREGVAWTFGLSEEEYEPEIEK